MAVRAQCLRERLRMTGSILDLSLGEFRALVAKAGRGAGFSWGLADDLAYSARRLAEFGVGSGPMVVSLLERIENAELSQLMPTSEWQASGELLCPICTGASIADAVSPASPQRRDVGPVMEPAFVAPLVSAALGPDQRNCVVSWDDGECVAGADSLRLTGTIPAEPAMISVQWGSTTASPKEGADGVGHDRVSLPSATFEALEQWAHRTYAPATDESRAAGAGSDQSDND